MTQDKILKLDYRWFIGSYFFLIAIAPLVMFLLFGSSWAPHKYVKPVITYIYFFLTLGLFLYRLTLQRLSFYILRPRGGVAAVIMLMTWIGLTFAWTEPNPIKTSALFTWIHQWLQILCVVLWCFLTSSKCTLKGIINGYLFGSLIFGIVLLMISPWSDIHDLGNSSELNHTFTPIELAYQFSAAWLISIYAYLHSVSQRTRYIYWFSSFLLLLLVICAFSKICIIAILGAFILFMLTLKIDLKSRLSFLVTFGLLLLAVTPLLIERVMDYLKYNASAGFSITSFTGRTDIWEFFYKKIWEHPWIGHGNIHYYFSEIDLLVSTHNEILKMLFAYGLIGFMLYAYLYGSYFKTVSSQLKNSKYYNMAVWSIVFGLFWFTIGLANDENVSILFPIAWMTCLFLYYRDLNDATQTVLP